MRLPTRLPSRRVATIVALALLAVVGWMTSDLWRPYVMRASSPVAETSQASADGHDHHDHAGHDHGDEADDSIEVTDQARKNIGLQTGEVTIGDFTRSVTIPGIVTERPGRTVIRVAAPLTGVVTDVFAEPGQSVKPGQPLFVLRLIREEIVDAQIAYLQTLEAINVENQEITRLESIRTGVIAEKVVLERKFERQKLEARARAERQALLLLGLSEEQVESIAESRKLLHEFQVVAPMPHDESPEEHGPHIGESLSAPSLILDELSVQRGDAVAAGQQLCTLADLSLLYLEGRAFERDAAALSRAAAKGWTVSAVPEEGGETISNLKIAHVENRVDADSRTLIFHAFLPNSILHVSGEADRSFPTWRFKLGQRMRVRLPVETWQDKIVLPVTALAEEGPDRYVFVENGPRFDRLPVHVEYRGDESVVIANDGSIFPGDVVALNGAHQLLMALKNKSVDASGGDHHGHMH